MNTAEGFIVGIDVGGGSQAVGLWASCSHCMHLVQPYTAQTDVGLQRVHSVAPGLLLYVPGGHSTQYPLLGDAYCPRRHCTHVPFSEIPYPGGHVGAEVGGGDVGAADGPSQ